MFIPSGLPNLSGAEKAGHGPGHDIAKFVVQDSVGPMCKGHFKTVSIYSVKVISLPASNTTLGWEIMFKQNTFRKKEFIGYS